MKFSVIGGGGWGTAIALVLAESGHDVMIWAYEDSVVSEINTNHTNSLYLKNVVLPENISATKNFFTASENNFLVFAVPTQFIRTVLNQYNPDIKNKIIINLSKGIEISTALRVSEIFSDVSGLNPENYVMLSGPSHAEEVSRKVPTAVVAASENTEIEIEIQKYFSTENFRVYGSNDVVGCEIGGALKNVIAIGAGIIDGLSLGDNTKAALITRGLAEISRLGISLGANPHTFSGLSGLGDLIVTCNSRHSRNRFVGEQIGKGRKLTDIISEMKMVAEGVGTTKAALNLARLHKVDAPIIEQMNNILFNEVPPLDAIKELMTRQIKREWWW